MKLLEKFGHVKQFDFLFHKSGPLEGQPRGYCFVNFNTREVRAGRGLNVRGSRLREVLDFNEAAGFADLAAGGPY